MKRYRTIDLKENPDWIDGAANWFHHKWDVPQEAYRESMLQSSRGSGAVPQWYIVLNDNDHIVGGVGLIENDFHKRRDLAPNVCALYVEPLYRGQGIARHLLDTCLKTGADFGLDDLYLITDHKEFYERCGWHFLTMAECDSGEVCRMYTASTSLCSDPVTDREQNCSCKRLKKKEKRSAGRIK